jgi:hypothetical protein
MDNVRTGRIVGFAITQKGKASGWSNYQGSSAGMEMEATRRVVNMGDDQINCCRKGLGLKNGEGDSRISLECHAWELSRIWCGLNSITPQTWS